MTGGNNVRSFEPAGGPLRGTLHVLGDKSISHRAVLLAAAAEGVSHLEGLADSADVRAAIEAVRALGARPELTARSDGNLAGTIVGWGQRGPRRPAGPIDCGNSGTTARLLMGLLAAWDIEVAFVGDPSLSRRPIRRVMVPLAQMGASFDPPDAETLPVRMRGTRSLRAITYGMPVASAQVKSAVLLAGAQAGGMTSLTKPARSRDHTELMLPAFGVPVAVSACDAAVSVEGPALLRAAHVRVFGDPSSAAFPLVAAVLVPGSAVRVEDVGLNPLRIGFLHVLARMGADVEIRSTGTVGGEPYGIIAAGGASVLRGCEVVSGDFAGLIDEVPVLALAAARACGVTVFRGAGELRVKESDRLAAVTYGINRLGARAWIEGDDLFIEGAPQTSVSGRVTLDAHGDHRLAMTWAVAGIAGPVPVEVAGFDCVSASYPGFREDMERLMVR